MRRERKKSRRIWGAVLVFLICQFGFAAAAQSQSPYPEPEAKEWLRNADADAAFAPSRFSTKNDAERFIERLYAAGSLYVGVINIMGDIAGLRVYLPLDGEKRKEIFEIANKESDRNSYPVETDDGQEELEIWF